MNKVLFDLQVTQPDKGTKRHGGGKFGESLLKRILERKLPVLCCYDSQRWLNDDIMALLQANNVELIDSAGSSLDIIALEHGVDLVYVPTNINFGHVYASRKCRILGTIHGIRDLESPTDYQQMLYKPYSNIPRYLIKRFLGGIIKKRRSRMIHSIMQSENFGLTTSSSHSSFSIKTFFPEYKDKQIPVFYCPSTIAYEHNSTKYNEKYFLLISGNRPIKNNLRAIMAFDRLFSNGVDTQFKVKITGVKNGSDFLYKIKNRDRFDFVSFVDEEELDQLYHDAYCLVYPTFNEGFGYPPIEAMHYGIPVLASPFTSIPEVCGDSVIYFNPFSVEEMMSRILMIMEEEIHKKYSLLSKSRFEVINKKQQEDTDRLIDYIFSY